MVGTFNESVPESWPLTQGTSNKSGPIPRENGLHAYNVRPPATIAKLVHITPISL